MTDDALLFVYGTLRRGTGHPMAKRLARESEWLGPASVAGALYRVDDYPAFVPGGGVVAGDLVRLIDPDTAFIWLDAYEGCAPSDAPPHEYRRVRVSLIGAGFKAQTYVWNCSLDGLVRIASGDWLTRPPV